MINETVVYVGKDLEAMDFAGNYHDWILDVFAPLLGKRLVEVGAGAGGFSELLMRNPLESLALIEPSRAMYSRLEQRVNGTSGSCEVRTYNSMFRRICEQVKTDHRPDSIIYVNVLEHVEDDAAELKAVFDTLEPGGRVFIFVPALRWLMSNYDRSIGHFRRYTRPELETRASEAGFKILHSGYFDLAGIMPWWVKYRLLRSENMEPGALKMYDKFVVPVTKVMESLVRPPIGKNLILIGEKTGK